MEYVSKIFSESDQEIHYLKIQSRPEYFEYLKNSACAYL